ncbi:AraC family transcriptional regulator [Streptococcus thoraltensis]|uniref:AraC family transcriptional regulator n=1 Tax=Streptococcus thoraltensis TaxID=55085 RepID=UPI001F5AD2CE|nr:helix-turn-helix domain-containing protein [Streptococcus thoraltensis]
MLDIFDILFNYQERRDWDEILATMHPFPAIYFGEEPVYEFFQNLNDELDINPHPIALSVNPIESFVPFHYHNYVEMVIPLRGSLDIVTENEEIHLEEGDIFIVGPNTIHKNRESHKGDLALNIALKPTAFSHTDLDFLRRNGSSSYLADLLFFAPAATEDEQGIYTVFRTQDSDGLMVTIATIVHEYYSILDNQSNSIIRYELLVLFAKLLRLSSKEEKAMVSNRKSESNLLSLLLYIETHYADITLEEMGESFGFNPNYLSTYLKKHTGMSFIKLLHLQRVNAAAEYLLYTNAPIEKIATKVGYENPSYFYKIFKKILGVSPAEYRKQAKNR